MSEGTGVGEYCRQVEDHLTRVNGGHLVRVVGPAFDLVRRWAEEGVPLSVVFRGIERKAERRAQNPRGRPLRLEFCEGDVVAVFDAWRRAIGLGKREGAEGDPAAETTEGDERRGRRPSLSKHLERAIDRLGRAAGRTDWPETLREEADRALVALAAIHETARRGRGAARDGLPGQLEAIDTSLVRVARQSAPAAMLEDLTVEAERDLAPFRARLPGDAWRESITVTVDRLLRDRLGLPSIVP